MLFISLLLLAPILPTAIGTFVPASTLKTDLLAAEGLVKLAADTLDSDNCCTLETAEIRREW